MPTVWIVLIVLAVIALFLVFMYNGLVRLRNMVDEAWNQISVQLKRRHDLIPNLVNAVKGYMEFEQETLTKVIEARNAAVGAQAAGPAQAGQSAQAENVLTGALRQLFALVENYPRAQGERERHAAPGAADHDGEPDRLLAPALQQHGSASTTPPSRRSRTSLIAGMMGFWRARLLPDRRGGCRGSGRGPQPEVLTADRSSMQVCGAV